MHLRIISLFENLTDVELASVQESCVMRTYGKQAEIVGEHESTADIFFILAGTVRVTSYTDAGKEVIFSDVTTGGVFGEFSAVDGLPRSASVVALTECKLARMTAPRFLAVLQRHNSVSVHLVELVVAKIRKMSERVFELSALAVRERVRRELLRLVAADGKHDGEGVTISPAPTHYEMAARIGSHREAVTREFNRLELEKIIEIRRRAIRITNLLKLNRMSD